MSANTKLLLAALAGVLVGSAKSFRSAVIVPTVGKLVPSQWG